MYTNADVTIYNKFLNPETRLDEYKRTVIKGVFFDEKEGSNRLQSGLESADSVLMLIPFDSLIDDEFISPKEFKGEAGTFTLRAEDKIVKGEIDYEIVGSTREFEEKYKTFTLTSVDTKDFGSQHMRHYEVGAK